MGISLRSRSGNAVVGVLGVFYFVAALALLAVDLVQTWGAASALDRAVQIVLVLSAVAGYQFAISAARNLGLRLPHREARLHREGAAVAR